MIETIKLGTLRWSIFSGRQKKNYRVCRIITTFHPLDIEDCKSPVNLRPKIDLYQDYHFLILHFPSMDSYGTFVETKEVKVFWGKDF